MTRDEKKAKDRWEYVSDRLCNSDYPIYNEEHELESAFDAGVKWCEEHPNWISVEDELPERGEDVLILTPQNLINIAAYEYRGLESKVPVFVSGIDGYSWRNVTHWQRLPQPPSSSEFPNNFKKGD